MTQFETASSPNRLRSSERAFHDTQIVPQKTFVTTSRFLVSIVSLQIQHKTN